MLLRFKRTRNLLSVLCPMFWSSLGAAETVLVIEHVTVIDATGAPARRDLSVLIQGDRIASLEITLNDAPLKCATVLEVDCIAVARRWGSEDKHGKTGQNLQAC